EYDVVYDTVGGQVFEDSYKVLKSGGILVSMVGQADEAKAKELGITVISQFTKVTTKRLEMLANLVDSGVVSAQIGQRFTFDQAAEAFAAKEAGQILGKILVTVSE